MDLIWRILAVFGRLREPDLAPGPWFVDYARDYADALGVPYNQIDQHLTSGVADGVNGWVWVTATPLWDRAWFESRGYSFPQRWVTWDSIEDASGELGSYLKLDI